MVKSLISRILFSGLVAFAAVTTTATAESNDERIDSCVNKIVESMSVDELLGQMTQLDVSTVLGPNNTVDVEKVKKFGKLKVGSYLNSPGSLPVKKWREIITTIQEISMKENGGHPIIYGLDSVHGAIYVDNAIVFGQQINAGATFNPELVYEMGRISGRDTEAAGIPWVFGPIHEIVYNPLWARTYETFGEDPYLTSVMTAATVKGLQSNNQTAACMKHFIGYSKTSTGHDREDVTMSDFDLLNYHAPPFIASIKAGAMTAMENYISINGAPVISSPKILRDLVRHDMKFDGLIVTDWAEINNLNGWHRVAKSKSEAVRMALTQTSLDMSMVPYETTFIDHAKELLKKYPQALKRIKDSVRRIITIKKKLGLYENPVPGKQNVDKVGSAEDYETALQMARESIVLLKNKDNVLPLKAKSSVFLTGHSADNIGYLCGGWTKYWQGTSGNSMFPNGVSIRQGFSSILGGNDTFTYFNGLNADGSYNRSDLDEAMQLASEAEYTIVAIGEAPYAEKPGDINDLSLPAGQIEYVRKLASTGTKVILVLVQGRPRLLNGLANDVHAVINAMLPGEAGGQAISEIVYGEVNPSGRLPNTYPRDSGNVAIQYYHRVTTMCISKTGEYINCENQWGFGAGLSYTTFEYRDMKLSTNSIMSKQDTLTASVTVKNTGKMEGKEVVMLFLTQLYRSISVPEVKMLKKFKKITLKPGESKRVAFELSFEDWSVYDPQIGNGFHRTAEDGDFVVAFKPETDCQVYKEGGLTNPLCAKFEVSTGDMSL